MKKLSFLTVFIILLGSSIISSCDSSGYKPADYISTTGIAEPGQETRIELEDGASISIPFNSLDSQVEVKIERNPEKAQVLPPMDENFVQLSDFYNFEVISGNLTGPVDLTFPINSDLIPDESGVLVMAIPTESGWEFVPVESKNGKVAIFTDQIGDPIIAWHFAENTPLCDPEIAVQGIQNGDKVEIIGKLLPVRKSLFADSQEEPASDIPVTIELNRQYGSGGLESYILSTTTQNDGSFSVTLDSSQGLKEGWNWIFVNAQCNKPWWGEYVVLSEGYGEFKYTPPVVEQASNSQPGEPPVVDQPTEPPIPAGAVLLPDFIGQPIDNAINWLEQNDFKYTWIDGSSTYDLGMVFNQAPAGNQYKVPHRTVVLLYRTIKTELATGTPNTLGGYVLEIQEQDCRTRSNGTTQCKHQPVTIALSYDENTETFYGESVITWEVTDYYRMSGVVYSASASSTETIKVEGIKSTRNDGYIRFSVYYSGTTIPPRVFDKTCCTLTDPSLTFDSGVHTFELKNEDGSMYTDGSIKEWPSASDFIQAILHIQK